nr:hypothetical protein [Tanacetum cinerariifolium]
MQPKVQVKDKGKAILIKEPKPLKRQAQIKLDEEVARQLEAELNANVNWNVVIDQFQMSEKLTDAVMKYQALKRKPLTEAQARRNMIVYLKNMAGYKMDYFKEISYDKIRPLFTKYYNNNQAFLNEVNEGVKVPEKEADPKNYSDDFLLNTLKIMFEKPNVEANVWKDQKGKYDLAKGMYPLTHFTLEQMMNDVRLEVKDESKMSVELLRIVRRQLNEGYIPQ